ncbi:bifunctional methylenetetrahydrofolate dehydrogenase/methenyltetrahydrofolate cyclohydrolase FolD [Mesorhizobium sp. SP-1A]|uniref:bifunctional methylenetetrahydrofolate dehydrogenase/methenyltetrahydrofolate cyclohydrolase FolD n=1 Tax=Mesorhizobium sp. SP-1A TaxID=3077840 RepID=UPI0028F71164|nr:bifunctional methylenetetrahydrofolate dehydrogenase/methenyltetrahydrofolate cyclohydrolase FolD [Mesorhizobium sp. SP-1A]
MLHESKKILSGKEVAEEVLDSLERRITTLRGEGVQPGLAVIIVGSDPASQVYVGSKAKAAQRCGFLSRKYELPEEITQRQLVEVIATLNQDEAIHGILVQLPLPSHIDSDVVIQAIAPAKDVDGFHFTNIGKLSAGHTADALLPCTPLGCMRLIEEVHGADLSGLCAVVVGRSNIVGKPMASLLLAANATVTVAHSRTPDLAKICAQADILVAAVGKPQLIMADCVKQGATVIDVGINRIANPAAGVGATRLVGDVDFESVNAVAGALTPVPGGVGPMTIAMLMHNTVRAAEAHHARARYPRSSPSMILPHV